jgi:hypothetical protein
MMVENKRTLLWRKIAAHGFLIASSIILFPFRWCCRSVPRGNFTGSLS